MYSEAQKRATIKYQKEHLVQLAIRMKPEEKDIITRGAEDAGLSIKNYLVHLAEKDQNITHID